MNITSASLNLLTAFSSSWASGTFKSTPLLYRNESTKPPQSGSWCEVDIIWGNGRRNSVSANLIVGSVVVNVFTQKGRGNLSSSLLTDAVRSVLVNTRTTDIRLDAPSGPVPVPNDGTWYMQVVSCPFQMDSDKQ